MKRLLVISIVLIGVGVGGLWVILPRFWSGEKTAPRFGLLSATPFPSPTPSPTPRVLTFDEMNELYGPCARVPTLMYHHIQDLEAARVKEQQNLTVSPEYLRQHLSHLQTAGYTTISMQELVDFFDKGAALPTKPVLITFDDGYTDFADFALPILNEYQAKATLFLPTGLADNPEYLLWVTIAGLPKERILVANHTWSHKNTQTSLEEVRREITTADTQLVEHGLNSPKIFSYPYGLVGGGVGSVLTELNYQLAFTTQPGSILCKKQRLTLPRIRIGNTTLANYGL